jgi:hypothetical protein
MPVYGDRVRTREQEMKDHKLGDQPIEMTFVEAMNSMAAGLDKILNGEAKGADRKNGFVLLVFPFGDNSGRCNYISNGADRKDIVKLFKEQIRHFEQDEVKP